MGVVVEHVVRLPQAIWARSGLPSEIGCSGDTVREALDDACRRQPGLAAYLAPGSATLPRSVLVFVDGHQVHEIATRTIDGPAVVRVVIPSAGG